MTETEFAGVSFYRFLDENKLMGSRCKQCTALYLPPRPICIKCHSSDMEWVQMKGAGKLAAFTTIAVGTSLMVEAGYDRNKHYCSGIVKLDEGPRISAQILGVDAQNPASVRIGTPVTVRFVKRKNKQTIWRLQFRVTSEPYRVYDKLQGSARGN